MTQDYWMRCNKFENPNAKDKGACLGWNPYYTNALWATADTKELWKGRNIALNHYDQKLLKQYSCDFKKLKPTECTDAWFAKTDGAGKRVNVHIPQNDPINRHTHKMLHYTIVFQIFVFL